MEGQSGVFLKNKSISATPKVEEELKILQCALVKKFYNKTWSLHNLKNRMVLRILENSKANEKNQRNQRAELITSDGKRIQACKNSLESI